MQPLSISSYPRAVLHIDGDAFFASCEQSRNPKLKGRPVITGKERGIVASMSYEAKDRGVTRAMRLFEAKKICPDAVFLPSDYETYSLLSRRFYDIVRRFTPDVEEYSIDECFADITGLRRPMRMSYDQIAEKIKEELDRELGFTFSLGLAPNKVLAKVASKWKKPSGLTVIPAYSAHLYLSKLAAGKIWGIGEQTSALLEKHRVVTALDFARRNEDWVKNNFSKPFYEIWKELNGRFVYELDTEEKQTYQSIQKVRTFSPPSMDGVFVFAQLSKNIENACIKLRRYKLAAQEAIFFLKQEDFRYSGVKVKFSHPTAIPYEIIAVLENFFAKIYKEKTLYRATGVGMFDLTASSEVQMDLFGERARTLRANELYAVIDDINHKYGKHTVYLGTSSLAHKHVQHEGVRGDRPERKTEMFKGESARRRLAVPMFLGEVK